MYSNCIIHQSSASSLFNHHDDSLLRSSGNELQHPLSKINPFYSTYDTIHIVLIVPDDIEVDITDKRHHLQFISIAAIPNYNLHIIGTDTEDICSIALIYLDPGHVTECTSSNTINSSNTITHVLRLELYMVINNPDNLHTSPLYISKNLIYNEIYSIGNSLSPICPKIHHAFLINKHDTHSIVYVSDPATAEFMIYINPKWNRIYIKFNINKVRISCLLVISNNHDTTEIEAKLIRSLRCYQRQIYQNKELIIITNTMYRDLVVGMAEIIEGECHIRFHNGSVPLMRNTGLIMIKDAAGRSTEEENGHYTLCWNLEDWYHEAFLSILADKAGKTNPECISLMHLIGYNKGEFLLSFPRYNGWEDVLMVRCDKYIPYSDVEYYATLHINVQWGQSATIYILENSYSYIYVKMNHIKHALDVPIPISINKYYQTNIQPSSLIQKDLSTFSRNLRTSQNDVPISQILTNVPAPGRYNSSSKNIPQISRERRNQWIPNSLRSICDTISSLMGGIHSKERNSTAPM